MKGGRTEIQTHSRKGQLIDSADQEDGMMGNTEYPISPMQFIDFCTAILFISLPSVPKLLASNSYRYYEIVLFAFEASNFE